ncbi:hypothetical protein ABLI39_11985 [Pseudarthrobacter sp. B907]|uniref:hypothetical protein n=1 Tax=Pseudarthrobacter sp. B907 TaxID=3158261 RepID=UPI0032DB4432
MRTSHARTPFHSLRAAMVATTIVVLAAAAHVVGGGQLPAPAILAAFFALTGLASTAATRLKLNVPAMTSLLGAGQVVLHEAFAAFSTPVAGVGPLGAPGHHDGVVPLLVPSAGPLQSHALDSALALTMFAGHALATLVCALLLARGEDALWQLAAWLRPLVQLPSPVTPRPVALRALPLWPAESLPLPWRNLRRDCRRGPPAVVVLS